ncbi:MAG: saccharopine dehydrogenase NADP-binding domain-containing protein [Thermoanaerobaculia bacterium]
MMDSQHLIYGANGFTGELIAREAVRRGLRPILAGRRREAIEVLATELELPSRVFELDDPGRLDEGLGGVEAVLHCAGPFVRTSRPMVDACLRTRTHYLDITGEIPVIEHIRNQSSVARESGVALLPSLGIDVVPSDCLAARLAEALPDATHLELAFCTEGGGISRGTMVSMVEAAPHYGAVRQDGEIVSVPFAFDAKQIDFSCGKRWTLTIPWGDIVTAHVTTGIPNIRVYAGVPRRFIARARRLRALIPALGPRPVKRLLQWWIGVTVTGPDQDARATGRTHLWGQVRNDQGENRAATMDTPEGYTLTATTAVECLRRVLEGAVEPGFQTPARAFGTYFVDELPGVTASDVFSRPPTSAPERRVPAPGR